MWVIHQENRIEIRSNSPEYDITDALRKQFPDARILRSKGNIANEVNSLIFAVEYLPGDLIEVSTPVLDEAGQPVLNDEGNPVFEKQEAIGPGTARPLGNTYALEGSELVVRSSAGKELGRWLLEVV